MMPRTRNIVIALTVPGLCAIAVNAKARTGALMGTRRDASSAWRSGALGPADLQQRTDWRKELWQVEFNLDHQIAIVTPKGDVPFQTKFNGMRYSVAPFPDMFVTPGTFAGGYWSVLKDPANGGQQEWMSNQAPPALPLSIEGRRELLVGRHADVCDTMIKAWTEGSKQAPGQPNTFVISNNFEWPTEWKVTTFTNPPVVITDNIAEAAPLYTPTEQEVPYDYTKQVNDGTLNLPLFQGPAASHQAVDTGLMQRIARMNGVTIPAGAMPSNIGMATSGPYRLVKRTITYKITRPTMELIFLRPCKSGESPGDPANPTCTGDLIGTRELVCAHCQQVTDNLAADNVRRPGDGVFIRNHYFHANIDVRLKIAGQDVTNSTISSTGGGRPHSFKMVRLMRDWRVALDDNGNPAPYPSSPPNWASDPTMISRPNWKDMPGPTAIATDLDGWKSERLVKEFLLAVKDFPEFGFVYYAIIYDMTPERYRFRQTDRKVTGDEWCQIKKSSTPQIGLTQVHDTGWQPTPARRTQ